MANERRDPNVRRPGGLRPARGDEGFVMPFPPEMSGMGDILEYAPRYPIIRAPMPKPPDPTVWTAPTRAPLPPGQEWIRNFVEEMKCQFQAMLTQVLQSTPQKASPPPWLAPPWFAKPQLIHNQLTLAAGDPFTNIIRIPAAQFQRTVITSIGTDAEAQNALPDLVWRLQVAGRTIPLFYDVRVPNEMQGCWSWPLGRIAEPLDLRALGLAPRIQGGGDVTIDVRNIGAVQHEPEISFGYYYYSMALPSENQDGDFSAICGGSKIPG